MAQTTPRPTELADLTGEDREHLLAMKRALQRADGFTLLIARVNLPRWRDRLAERLKREVADEMDVVEIRLTEPLPDLAHRIAERLREDERAGGDGEVRKRAVFVYGLEHSMPSGGEPVGSRRHAPLAVLNLKRELLKETAPVPVVLWLPEYALRVLMEGAPDLWAWRGGVFEFTTPPREAEEIWAALRDQDWMGEYDRMTYAERRERADTVAALLEQYDAHPDADKAEMEETRLRLVDRLARLRNQLGDLAKAELLYRRALEARERMLGLEHPGTLVSMNELGLLLDHRNKLDEAESLIRGALGVMERRLGPDDPGVLALASNLGYILEGRGDLTEAEALFRRVLETRERVLGSEHADTLTSIGNLGNLLESRGDVEGAEAFYRRALETRARVLGARHPRTLTSVANLGYLLTNKGSFDEAEMLLRRAVEGKEHMLGPEHPDTLISLSNLGTVLRERGDLAGAEKLYQRALNAGERVLGPEHPNTEIYRKNLARLLEEKEEQE